MKKIIDEIRYVLMFLTNKINVRSFYEMTGIEHTWGHEIPCLNLGYWKNASTMDEANINMFRLVADHSNFKESDILLDVGCGFGVQDHFFLNNYSLSKITAITISETQLKIASEKYKLENLSFEINDATNLSYNDKSFDKITAIESPFHFNTRAVFFKEAYRVLKPNGRMVIADMVFAPTSKKSIKNTFSYYINKISIQYPKNNMYDLATYKSLLEKEGFVNVKIISIGFYVYPFFRKYVIEHKEILNRFFIPYRYWLKYLHLFNNKDGHYFDYIIAIADKP